MQRVPSISLSVPLSSNCVPLRFLSPCAGVTEIEDSLWKQKNNWLIKRYAFQTRRIFSNESKFQQEFIENSIQLQGKRVIDMPKLGYRLRYGLL